MMLLTTIEELIALWKSKLAALTNENNEQIAADIVGSLAASDSLWDQWYRSGKEPNIQIVVDNTADLELPNGIKIKDADERGHRWRVVRVCVKELEDKYLKQNDSRQ